MEIELIKCTNCGGSDFSFAGNFAECKYCGSDYMIKGGAVSEITVVHKSKSPGKKYFSCHSNLKLKIAHCTYCRFENNLFETNDNDVIRLLEKLKARYFDKPLQQRVVMDTESWNEMQYEKQERSKMKNNEAKNWKIKL